MVLGLSVTSRAVAQPVDKYGEFMVLNTLLWLPSHLEVERMALEMMDVPPKDRIEVIGALREAANSIIKSSVSEQIHRRPGWLVSTHDFKPESVVRFQHEASGVFNLPDAPAPRFAVTGDAIDSPVIFNLDRISDPRKFGFAQALRLWIHELGHKVIFDKSITDKIAAAFGREFGAQVVFENSLLLFNGTPFKLPGRDFFSPVQGLGPMRKWNRLAVIHGGRLNDLTTEFNDQLDRLARPLANHYEMDRILVNSKVLSPGHFTVDVLVFRKPKREEQYMVTDLGGPHRFTAEFKIDFSNSQPRLEVLNYAEMRRQLKRLNEAGLEILKIEVQDGKIQGRLRLRLFTEKYFHAAGYPIHDRSRLILKSGTNTVEVPLDLRADMRDPGWGGMPAEIYTKETVKHGNFSGELPPGWPAEFEVIGLVDEFFGMGPLAVGYAFPMLVSMDRPFHFSNCEPSLLPPAVSSN